MNIPEKLHDAYGHLVDTVHHLVHKDKKPLSDALLDAKEMLSEWGELTKEEIDEIHDDLKSRLYEMGRDANEISASMSEKLKLEMGYVGERVWEKLEQVADQTQIELRELMSNLDQGDDDDKSDNDKPA